MGVTRGSSDAYVGVSRGVSGEIVLQVENAHCGFNTLEDIAGLEIAGSSRVFHPVTACSFDNRKELLSVRCDDVAEPEYVRYCWGIGLLETLSVVMASLCNHLISV